MSKRYGSSLMAVLIALFLNPAMAQTIYKTIDENGNVVFSDTNPDGEGVPMKLRELSVVKPGNPGLQPASGEPQTAGVAEAAEVNMSIASPQPEATIWNTAYVLSASVNLTGSLPEGAQLAYIVDGEVKATGRSTSVQISEVYRGEHQLRVELRSAEGRVLSSAGPVTFYMRQGSAGGSR